MNLGVIRRIASWEVSRQFTGVDASTVVIALLLLSVSGGVAAFTGTPSISEELYTVGVVDGSEYQPAFEQTEPLRVQTYDSEAALEAAFENNRIDLAVYPSGEARPQETQRGAAALTEAIDGLDAYNDEQLELESDEEAAFPVGVSVLYVEQSGGPVTVDNDGDGTDDESSTGDEAQDARDEGQASTTSEPASIQPPFPFESLLLAFAFLLPMNFIVQAYASSVIDERLNRRGELLLVSPVSQYDIIAGKTLPYLLALVGITIAVAVALGAGALSVLALLPFSFAYLAAGFLAGVFARSYQELTFLVLTISVFFTAFAFVPAIFVNVLPISSISPLSVVVTQLQGEAVPLNTFLFSTLPLLVVGTLVFVLGGGIYREEDLFAQRPVPAKAVDAVAAQLSQWRSVFWFSALAIPFVFVAELLVVAGLFVIPPIFSLPALLTAIAFVEEVAKAISIYSGFERDLIPRTREFAVKAGFASGAGFFIGEKLFVAAQAVGLQNVTLGQIAFSAPVGTGVPTPLLALALLVTPLLLHTVTAIISSLGARRGAKGAVLGVLVATLVHVIYNLTVVMLLA